MSTAETSLTLISERETFEFLTEGLRQASSAAAQLGELQRHQIWSDISSLLLELHNNAVDLHKSKPISRFDALRLIDNRQKQSSDKLDAKRPATPKFLMN